MYSWNLRSLRNKIHAPRAKALIGALLGLMVLIGGAFSAYAQGPGGGNTIYMPLLSKGQQTTQAPPTQAPPTQPPPTQPPPTQPPPGDSGSFWVFPESKTQSGAIQVDADGGMHLGFAVSAPAADNPPAIYMYCPGKGVECADPTNWNGVSMAMQVDEVQLQLSSDGQPHMLIRAVSQVMNGGKDYLYATCPVDCTDPANWAVSLVWTSWGTDIFDVSDRSSPNRSFALDPQGRPRFIFFDRNYLAEPDHTGVYYAQCDADCATDPGAWSITLMTPADELGYDYEYLAHPSLTFTSSGAPRVVGQLDPLNSLNLEMGVYYLECDTGCESSDNWSRVWLYDRGSTPEVAWDIELDSKDRPRIIQYYGDTIDTSGDQLVYHWCNTNCADPSQWQYVLPGFGERIGMDADLELDAQGRPRLAYMINGGGLGFGYCNGNCDKPQSWVHKTVETHADIMAEFPVATPPGCNGVWDTYTPVLSLDADGNPHIVYDLGYHAGCLYDSDYDPNTPPEWGFWEIFHTVHGVFFPKP